jgi:hypothetical protein
MARLFSSTSVETTLASGINSSVTSMTVATGTGSSLTNGVTIGTGNQFTVAIDPDTSNEEIVFITVQSTDTFTITRGQAGTTAVTHSAGATVRHVLTSDDLNYFNGAVPAAIVDAKGDLIVATAADTVSRLAVGTNNTRLVADSAQATGLKYVADTQNTVVDAKGDLIVGTAADTVDRLAIGANNTRLVADSAQTTGAKWVADTQNTVVDAEGDLLVGGAADTIQRLAIGSNGQYLAVDTGVSGDIKWVGFRGCSLTKSATQSTANDTFTSITFDSEEFDTDAYHSTSTNNSRITIPTGLGGKYRINGVLSWLNNATGIRRVRLVKNGTTNINLVSMNNNGSSTVVTATTFSLILDLVATDYIEVQALQGSGSSLNVTVDTRLQAEYLGA